MNPYALAQAGDPDALAALVRQHIPLVQALSHRFSYSEDAFQQGCMGLVTAIRRFRAADGWRFSTYAAPLILGEMRRAFSRGLGWRARAALNRAKRFRETALQATGREPAIADAARAAGVPPEELTLLLEWDRQSAPMDETLLDALPDPRGEDWLTRLFIRDIVSRMEQSDGWLLRQRFFLGRSQSAVARTLGITQSAASRREKAARMRFRAAWMEGC